MKPDEQSLAPHRMELLFNMLHPGMNRKGSVTNLVYHAE